MVIAIETEGDALGLEVWKEDERGGTEKEGVAIGPVVTATMTEETETDIPKIGDLDLMREIGKEAEVGLIGSRENVETLGTEVPPVP